MRYLWCRRPAALQASESSVGAKVDGEVCDDVMTGRVVTRPEGEEGKGWGGRAQLELEWQVWSVRPSHRLILPPFRVYVLVRTGTKEVSTASVNHPCAHNVFWNGVVRYWCCGWENLIKLASKYWSWSLGWGFTAIDTTVAPDKAPKVIDVEGSKRE